MSNEDLKNPKNSQNPQKNEHQNNNYNLSKLKAKKLRSNTNSVLATVFCTGFLAIGITLFSNHETTQEKYQFPEQISLSGWELQSSQNLEQPLQKGAIAAQQYIFNSPQQADLNISIIYIKGVTTIPRDLSFMQLPTNLPITTHYQNTTGHYAVFNYSQRSYLAACINPRGQSTITEEQFMNNRNSYDITGDRLLLYAIGMADLRDTRCLLTIISIPLNNSSSNSSNNPQNNSQINNQTNQLNNSLTEQNHQKLATIWEQWYQLWQGDFPM